MMVISHFSSEGAGDTRLLRPGHVLRPDRVGEGNQAGDRPNAVYGIALA